MATARNLAIPARSRAALRAALRQAYRSDRRWPPSGRTPEVPFGRPQLFAASPDIAPRLLAAIGAAALTWLNHSIRWAGFFAIWRTLRFLQAPLRQRKPTRLATSPVLLMSPTAFFTIANRTLSRASAPSFELCR